MEDRETRIDMIADLLARENVSRAEAIEDATEIFEIATQAIDSLPLIDRHGVDRSVDAEAKRIDDAYERGVQWMLRQTELSTEPELLSQEDIDGLVGQLRDGEVDDAYERSLDLEQRRRDHNVE